MIDKEFVLVSQGIEIYRTKSQENAVNMVKEYNDEYFDYLQKCYDNYERPADNYVDLEIEYSNKKEKDKEIERLKEENTILKQTMSNNSLLINENAFLKERIDKAIEYIEQHNDYFLLKREVKELLDILKGVDKE